MSENATGIPPPQIPPPHCLYRCGVQHREALIDKKILKNIRTWEKPKHQNIFVKKYN